ncbi:beta-1,3-glucan-binding protein-like [Anticarsia gemmatalis]|uniref:beta-1,3-glucan-binding protein-like n=1 Tax=Anticarsia gemmatalis TaxID=129554 RepID=UPI003F761E8E
MWCLLIGVLTLASLGAACKPSVTTVSGSKAPGQVCSGAMIFQDEFDNFDFGKWKHENTLGGGGNWEFQYYNNNRTNSFVQNGRLYIRPSMTADQFGEDFLYHGTLNIQGGDPDNRCTNPNFWGCERTGTPTNIINPIKSARIHTVNTFNFRYGRLEVRAKMPAGDWLWPAIWLLPAKDTYGTWPASGEIDVMETRGNRNLMINGNNIGTQEAASTLHYGPKPGVNGFQKTHWAKKNPNGYNSDFHRYQLEWTTDYIKFSIDDAEIGRVTPGQGGFWQHGGFSAQEKNPWPPGSKMAPFDQQFYIILNLAVGGTTGYFPDIATNPTPKPWKNTSPSAMADFWKGRSGWEPTWNLKQNNGEDASLQVDYVRVWAL